MKDDSSSEGGTSSHGGLEALSDDDESFKYQDVTLFEIPPPRPVQRELLEGKGPPSSPAAGH